MKVMENNEKNLVDFADLDAGDCFRYQGDLCVKSDYRQEAISLNDGTAYEDMCGERVTPVSAEVQIID